MLKKGPVIWVEGIIGAGKSTLTKALAKALNLRPLFEPVDANPYLEDFYKAPKRWAFPMQMHLLHTRYNMQQLAAREALLSEDYNGAILDRGMPGDRVFCKMHMHEGNMSLREWDTYQLAYEVMACSLVAPSLLIFLDTEPAVAHERVIGRDRNAEEGLPLKYLQDLRKGYLDLLCEIESGVHSWSRGMDVKRVAWNTDHLPVEPLIEHIQRAYRIS